MLLSEGFFSDTKVLFTKEKGSLVSPDL